MSHSVAFLIFGQLRLQKRVVGRHLMFAQGAQNRAGLGVDGRDVVELAAEMNRAVRLQRQAEIDPFARDPFEVGEQPGHGVGVVPDVAAGARGNSRRLPSRRTGRCRTGSRSKWPGSTC